MWARCSSGRSSTVYWRAASGIAGKVPPADQRRYAPGVIARGPRLYAYALAASVLACAAAAAAAPKPKKPTRHRARTGKVVRVERNQPKVASAARLCALYDADVGYCRHAVSVDNVGLILDEQGYAGP